MTRPFPTQSNTLVSGDVVEAVVEAIGKCMVGSSLEEQARAALAACRYAELEAENERLKAENERLSRTVCSDILGGLLAPDENEALLDFVKSLRANASRPGGKA